MLSRLHQYIGTMGLKTLHFPGHLNGWALVLTLERTETFRLRQLRYDDRIDRQPNTHSNKTVEFIGFCKGRCTLMPSSWHVVAKSVHADAKRYNRCRSPDTVEQWCVENMRFSTLVAWSN